MTLHRSLLLLLPSFSPKAQIELAQLINSLTNAVCARSLSLAYLAFNASVVVVVAVAAVNRGVASFGLGISCGCGGGWPDACTLLLELIVMKL